MLLLFLPWNGLESSLHDHALLLLRFVVVDNGLIVIVVVVLVVVVIILLLVPVAYSLSKKWWKRHEEKMRKRGEKDGEWQKKKNEGSFCMLLFPLLAGSALFPKKIKQSTVSPRSVYVRACQILHSYSFFSNSRYSSLYHILTDFILLLLQIFWTHVHIWIYIYRYLNI